MDGTAEPARRRALAFVIALVLIDTIGFGIVMPVMPDLIMQLKGEDLAHAAVDNGWLWFAFALAQFVAAPILGNLSDRYGRRPVLMFSLLAFGIDYAVMGSAPTFAWLFLGRTLAGIAGATYAPANAYLADITAPEKRAQAFGTLGAAFGVGFILGPAIGGLLGAFGPRAPFFAAALLAFANLAFGLVALPESLPKESRRPFEWRRANPVGAIAHVRQYPHVLALAGAMFLWVLGTQVFPSAWAFYAKERFGWDVALIGASMAFAGFVMIVGQGYLTARIIPRLGERKTALLGLGVGGAGFVLYALANQGWMIFAILPTWALGGLVMPSMTAMMSARVPATAQGELQGVNASLFSLSSILGPPLMTGLFGAFGAPRSQPYLPGAPFLAAAILAFLGALALARIAPRPVGASVPTSEARPQVEAVQHP
jgi:DHA1 family tetracycline resistance protein-like MFS transporter